MKRALALAAAMTALTVMGAGCAAKNEAPPPTMKTSYPSPDYPPQTGQPPATASPQPVAPPAAHPLYGTSDQGAVGTAPAPQPVATPAADTPRPMPPASSGMRPAGAPGKPGGPMLSRLFDIMDTDHNGRVTLEEWRAFREQEFRRLDTDHNGVLSREEFSTPPPLPGRGARPAP